MANIIITWLPALLKAMPHIIKAVEGLAGLWKEVRKTKEEDDKVSQALLMLKKHQDDIDKFIEDPERRKDLMEGLMILMTKIQNVDRCQMNESGMQTGAGYLKGSLCCNVCVESFNTAEQRPMLMPMCGHTICKSCLRKIGRSSPFHCPVCRKETNLQVEDFPTNIALLGLLTKEEDFTHCEEGKSKFAASSLTLSYEEQIQYALFLSRQDMSLKKEEDPTCFLSQQEEQENEFPVSSLSTSWAKDSHRNQDFSRSQSCHEKTPAACTDCHCGKEWMELEESGDNDSRYMANATPQENAEESSIQFAIRLQEEEILCADNSFGNQEMMKSQFCQGQTSTPGLDWQSKKTQKRKIKEQENLALAIALSLSLQDEPNRELPDDHVNRVADSTDY